MSPYLGALARRLVLPATGTLALLFAFSVEPVQAQTLTTLVSNSGQRLVSSNVTISTYAQQFTTGSEASGYTLSSVEFLYAGSNREEFAASLCTVISSVPTTDCTALTAGGTVTIGFDIYRSFTAPASTSLAASTTYAIKAKDPDIAADLIRTQDDGEDTGGAAGWSMANAYNFLAGNTWSLNSEGNSLVITIRGYVGVVTTTESDDATLSALALTEGTTTTTVTLSPTFASGTDAYTASVANTVTSVTVSGTANDAANGATVAYSGTDADSAAGHQVDLDVGSNTITVTVTVTAEDDSTTETYTVTVTRRLPSDATLSEFLITDLLSGNLPNPTPIGT